MIRNQSKNMPFTHLSYGVDDIIAAFFMSPFPCVGGLFFL